MAGAPSPDGQGRVPNITPAKLNWSEGEIYTYLTTGFTPDYDSVGGHMAHVVDNMAQLPETDVRAVVAYLKALGPIGGLSHHALALATHDGTLEFLLPPEAAADQVSASASAAYAGSSSVTVPCLTLQSALLLCDCPRADIVKMDIEGAEYAVLNQALDEGALDAVSQLMVEFHHFLPGLDVSQTRQVIGRLQQTGFRISWVGRTNHEYLFLRR
jgi:FkbM family methyltransferase